MEVSQQTYTYGGKVWTHEEFMALDRRQRYELRNKEKRLNSFKERYQLNKEECKEYQRNNYRFKRTFKELCMIEI
jgi:hypothetical protein